jgi:hypothetical protein
MTRRQIVKSAGIGVAAIALGGIDDAQAQVASVKALVFDTFGTVVDWRGSIVEEGKAWEKTKGITIDWARFADRWRAGYGPSMEKVRKGEMPWTNLDCIAHCSKICLRNSTSKDSRKNRRTTGTASGTV